MPTKKSAGSVDWSDPDDAPELTTEMRDTAEVFDGDNFVRRGRGRPKSDAAKQQISVRLDPDVVAKLRESGPGWQSRINDLLRDGLGLGAAGKRAAAERPGLPEDQISQVVNAALALAAAPDPFKTWLRETADRLPDDFELAI